MVQQPAATNALPRWALFGLVGVIGIFAGFGMRLVWAQGFAEPTCDPTAAVGGPGACNAPAPVLQNTANTVTQTLTSPLVLSSTSSLESNGAITLQGLGKISTPVALAGQAINVESSGASPIVAKATGDGFGALFGTGTGLARGVSAIAENGDAVYAYTSGTGYALNAQTLAGGKAANLQGSVAVTGNTTLTGTLTVSGASTLNGTLTVSGATTITNSLAVNSLTVGGLPVGGAVAGEVTSLITKASGTNATLLVNLRNELAWPPAPKGRRISGIQVLYYNAGWIPLSAAGLIYQEYSGSCLTDLTITKPTVGSTKYRIAVTYYTGDFFNCTLDYSPKVNSIVASPNPLPSGASTTVTVTTSPSALNIAQTNSVSFYGNGTFLAKVENPGTNIFTLTRAIYGRVTFVALATNGTFTSSSGPLVVDLDATPPPTCSNTECDSILPDTLCCVALNTCGQCAQ